MLTLEFVSLTKRFPKPIHFLGQAKLEMQERFIVSERMADV